MRNFLLKLG